MLSNIDKIFDTDVYLIMGQSNASGNSPYSYLETKDNESYTRLKDGIDNVYCCYYNHLSTHNDTFEKVKFGFGEHESLFGPEVGIAEENC